MTCEMRINSSRNIFAINESMLACMLQSIKINEIEHIRFTWSFHSAKIRKSFAQKLRREILLVPEQPEPPFKAFTNRPRIGYHFVLTDSQPFSLQKQYWPTTNISQIHDTRIKSTKANHLICWKITVWRYAIHVTFTCSSSSILQR